jgi:hypothetical protein
VAATSFVEKLSTFSHQLSASKQEISASSLLQSLRSKAADNPERSASSLSTISSNNLVNAGGFVCLQQLHYHLYLSFVGWQLAFPE